LQGELDTKLGQLAEIEADLANTEGGGAKTVRHSPGPSPSERRRAPQIHSKLYGAP
jgi:hypothetical protein